MSQDHLGLFDTPPTRRQIQLSIAIVAALALAGLAIIPVANVRWPEVPAFVPVVNTVIVVGDIIIAAMFSAQAAIFRSRSLVALASGYLFIGLILIPQTLTFPGVFAPSGLLGADWSTAAWFAAIRRIALPFIPILYVVLRRDTASVGTEDDPKIALGLACGAGLAAAITLIVVLGQDYLPAFFNSRNGAIAWKIVVLSIVTIALSLTAMALVFRSRKSVLDMWLIVALASWIIQSVMNIPLHARYSVGWYALYLMMLVSNMIILVALIAESNRLYARLAMATAARNRERQAQRMSVDGVAAAISHEVGQPLTALSLNVTAALASLTANRPNVDKAIVALEEIQNSANRSFDVLKSIRSMFGREPGWAGELDLNDLVQGSISRLKRELAAARVALDVSLEPHLPPLTANRVQLQQVLDNLIVNALESLNSTRGRKRQVAVRTARGKWHVRLEVSDNGKRIAEEDKWRVFDTFQDGGSDTNGIRLSLCRTIVEEHGGRIWVTPGEKYGTTFHVELPSHAD